MPDEILHWIIAIVVAVGIILAAQETFADGLLQDCPAETVTPAQAQRDCTIHAALQAHGGDSDLDRLERDCDGRICTYREKPLVGKIQYDVYPYGIQEVYYPNPYHGD